MASRRTGLAARCAQDPSRRGDVGPRKDATDVLRGGRLMGLGGEVVVFTGKLSMVRTEARDLVTSRRGRVSADVSGSTTVVVQGAPSPNYLWGDVGLKLHDVSLRREEGQDIYVLAEQEFVRLIRGDALSRAETSAARSGELSPIGIAYRPSRARKRSRRSAFVDLDALDPATRSHGDLVEWCASRVKRAGHEPLQGPSWCMYDMGWRIGGKRNVIVEVKTFTGTPDQQLRLGIGQVLDYAERLREEGFRPRPVLLVPSVPSRSKHWLAVAGQAGVELAWPSTFGKVLQS